MKPRRWVSAEAVALVRATGERDPVTAIQKLAADLVDDAGFDGPPFDPALLASLRSVREVRQLVMTSAARLVPEEGGLVIEVNRDHSMGKQHFSVNHETSHTLMPTYSGGWVDDPETGTFPSNLEEEALCDVGAAALLLDPRWLRPLALAAGPSIATLIELTDLFGASLQATVRQLAMLDLWPCAFVFWEEGWRKAQRIALDQPHLPELAVFGRPAAKLRVANCYASPSFSSSGCFIPDNKSVPDTSLVAVCCEFDPYTFGLELFDLGRGTAPVQLHSENWYAPYRKGVETRRRVISLLLPTGAQSMLDKMPATIRLESF